MTEQAWIPPEMEAEVERAVDALVIGRLRRDSAYLHAESNEAQAIREEEIAEEAFQHVCAKLRARGRLA